ncbi:hypothetical protein MRX96_029609 [Rhipicephalus microplus]
MFGSIRRFWRRWRDESALADKEPDRHRGQYRHCCAAVADVSGARSSQMPRYGIGLRELGEDSNRTANPFGLSVARCTTSEFPEPYWDDRLHTLRMGGPNVVDFYIDWSGHEPEPGQYNFADNYDLVAFLEAVKKADLLAIVRPGPYICGEVDNAGLTLLAAAQAPGHGVPNVARR